MDVWTRQQSQSKLDLTAPLQAILDALFRVFDTDKSGALDGAELFTILSSWLTTALNLATDIVLRVEDLLYTPDMQATAAELSSGLRGASSHSLAIPDVLHQLLAGLPDAPAAGQRSELSLRAALRALFPDADARVQQAADKLAALQRQLEAAPGPLTNKDGLRAAEPVLEDVARLFLAPEAAAVAAGAVAALADREMARMGGPAGAAVPRQNAEWLCAGVAEKLRAYVGQVGRVWHRFGSEAIRDRD
jgi:hypothetical protein